jgi:ketosteroid isomerase-like protein
VSLTKGAHGHDHGAGDSPAERRLAHAKRALDVDAIERIYADDLVLTGVMGEPTCTKAAIIDEIRRGIAERDRSLASGQQVEITPRTRT